MAHFTYGPVELYLVGFEGDRPDPGVIQALIDLVDGGLVRLLDFVIVSKSDAGEVTVTEVEDDADFGFGELEFAELGLSGSDDIDEVAESLEPGQSAALVAFELAYARNLAEKLAASGGVVLRTERIPAPIVNEILDIVEQD